MNHPKFLYWRGLPDSFLWLHGFAGCGKTVLCSTVIHNVSKHTASLPRSAFAFYYFDFTNDVKTKSLSCLRSIILQLVEQTADTASLEALQRTYASGTPPPQELLQVLKGMLCKCNRAYIVVDALDECTDQDELFELLDSIRDWKLECLSLLVTSRDEPDIRECVDPTAEQEMLLENLPLIVISGRSLWRRSKRTRNFKHGPSSFRKLRMHLPMELKECSAGSIVRYRLCVIAIAELS